MKPSLFTFDIFGTVLDWQTGLTNAVRQAGYLFDPVRDMDRVVDVQGADEQAQYRAYRDIMRDSLINAFGMAPDVAVSIGAGLGAWPLFADSTAGMKALMKIAPCIAMTNSDYSHGEMIQAQLGFPLTDWICAEEARVYKPNPAFWHIAAQKSGVSFGRHWWHVSAYADYDLSVARELGLTCVYIPRPHCRPGFSHYQANNLLGLSKLINELQFE